MGYLVTNFSVFFLMILRLIFKMFAELLSLVHLDGCPAKIQSRYVAFSLVAEYYLR